MFFFTLPLTSWKLFNLPGSTPVSVPGSTTAKGSNEAQYLKKGAASTTVSGVSFVTKHSGIIHAWAAWPWSWDGVLSPFSSPPKPPHHIIQPCHTGRVSPYPTCANQVCYCNSQVTSIATYTDHRYTTPQKETYYSRARS